MAPDEQFLPAPAVCKRYRISRPTLRAWLKRPGLGFPRPRCVGNRLFFSLAELIAWESEKPDEAAAPVGQSSALTGPITSYDSLIGALRQRRLDLGLSCATVDEVGGLQGGYTSKLETFRLKNGGGNVGGGSGRSFGPVTLPLWLGALGVGLQLVEVPDGRKRERSPRKADGGRG